MSEITFIKRWIVHLSINDLDALCGEPEPGLVLDEVKDMLPCYELCGRCRKAIDKRS